MEKNEGLLVVDNLVKHFKTTFGTVRAVDGISFAIKPGETFGLVGESGSGKSTTGYVIMGIYTPTSGKIVFKGEDISNHAKKATETSEKGYGDSLPGSCLFFKSNKNCEGNSWVAPKSSRFS